jgi:hypothetical protein
VSMRVALALSVACAALGLAACGGDDEPATSSTTSSTTSGATGTDTFTGTSTTSTSTSTTGAEGAPIEEIVANAAKVSPDEVECGDEGLESVIGSGGTCAAAGTEYVVADYGEELELDTLTAKIDEISEDDQVRGNYLKPQESKEGVFVVATLSITNESDKTALFDDFGEQVQLVAGAERYDEPFAILNGVATDSFLWKQTRIHPGETTHGDVVFDIPESAAAELDASGSIQILNFGFEGNIRRSEQIGLLRTGESAL